MAAAIRNLNIAPNTTALLWVLALRDQLDARIVEAVGAFDVTRGWDTDGATSMEAWLKGQPAMTAKASRRLVSLAATMRQLPVCAAAYADGALSSGQIDVITANLDDSTIAAFAESEAELVPYLAPLTMSGCSRAMAAWKSQAEPESELPTEPDRTLSLAPTLDGRYTLDGSLDAVAGATIEAALRLATDNGFDDRPPAKRTADAMVDICRFFLDNQNTRPGGRHRPHLNVVIEHDALLEGGDGRIVGGPVVDGTAVSQMLCDSAVHRVVMSGRSAILDYGTSTRTISPALWSALVIRDERCRFPGCDRPSEWCEGHHVQWVTKGGPTQIGNLVLVCARHHHRFHQPGWQAKLLPDATFEVTDPNGLVRCTSPPRRDPAW